MVNTPVSDRIFFLWFWRHPVDRVPLASENMRLPVVFRGHCHYRSAGWDMNCCPCPCVQSSKDVLTASIPVDHFWRDPAARNAKTFRGILAIRKGSRPQARIDGSGADRHLALFWLFH